MLDLRWTEGRKKGTKKWFVSECLFCPIFHYFRSSVIFSITRLVTSDLGLHSQHRPRCRACAGVRRWWLERALEARCPGGGAGLLPAPCSEPPLCCSAALTPSCKHRHRHKNIQCHVMQPPAPSSSRRSGYVSEINGFQPFLPEIKSDLACDLHVSSFLLSDDESLRLSLFPFSALCHPGLMDGFQFLRFWLCFFFNPAKHFHPFSVAKLANASHQRMCWEAHTREEGKEQRDLPPLPPSPHHKAQFPPSSLKWRFHPTAALGGSWTVLPSNLLLSNC